MHKYADKHLAGIDGREAFERLARRHFGDVSAQTLCDLTDWDYSPMPNWELATLPHWQH